MLRGKFALFLATLPRLTLPSPLKPEELQVLRAQYEKEGEYVGVQTKFNYAWVRCQTERILVSCLFALHTHLDTYK